MAFNHVAFATRDLQATHAFYTEAMGFELAKVIVGPTDHGWAKHVFYKTGDDEMIAFWDLHDDTLPADFPTDLSKARGLPGGSITSPSTRRRPMIWSPPANAGRTRASPWSRSTMASACRSTPPTPTGSSSSSATTRGRSTRPTRPRRSPPQRPCAAARPGADDHDPSRHDGDATRGPRRPGGLGYWPEEGDSPAAKPAVNQSRSSRPTVRSSAGSCGRRRTGSGGRPSSSTHPRADFSDALRGPLLADAGYGVFGFASRYVNNDSDCMHEVRSPTS